MKKNLIHIIFMLFISTACEEVYEADLENVANQVVIESLITNDPNVNFVKISKTRGFYAEESQQMVSGAKVELIDEHGQVFDGVETSTGYFVVNHAAVVGRNYQLRVVAEGETYESAQKQMPPLPAVDSLYVLPETKTVYYYSSYGEPVPRQVTGMHAYVDLPVTDSLDHYRFDVRSTLEYVIPPPPVLIPPPPIYCWMNFLDRDIFNIKGPSKYSDSELLRKHSLLFKNNTIGSYITQETVDSGAYMVGWIVDVEQFGISNEVYNYYDAMNDQLEAEGKLFDPVYAQLEPNIHCITKPEKEVLGLFELSSYRYWRFWMMVNRGSENAYWHLVDDIIPIPASGRIQADDPPDFWQTRNVN